MTASAVPTQKYAPAPADIKPDARRAAVNDNDMIKAASALTRDLLTVKPVVYWTDLLISAFIGYGALFTAIFAILSAGSILLGMAAAVISVFALYRAGSFIHELTHVKRRDLPGFHLCWNMLIGIPLLLPSFMYEGIHNQHHMPRRYGTAEDPEYLPLALMKPYTVPLFVLVAALGPIGVFFRYAILAPLSLSHPALRRLVVEQYSGLIINPAFRRRSPEGEERSRWIIQETAASIWAIALLTATAAGFVPIGGFAIFLAVASAIMVMNQIRTLVAHLWENDGAVMTATEQYLDSVNVPPPGTLPELWAPVGLRFHALHHLLPGVPYHNLGEAHRRLVAALPGESRYHAANHRGLNILVRRLVKSSITHGR